VGSKFWYGFFLLIQITLLLAACSTNTSQQKDGQPVLSANATPETMAIAISGHNMTAQNTPTQSPETRTTQGTTPFPQRTETPHTTFSPTPVRPTPTPTRPPVQPTPTQISNANGSTAEEQKLTQQLFTLINQDRAVQNLPPYTWNATLARIARQHSVNMSRCGLNHACPGEPDPCQRVLNAGIRYMACGENVGYTSPTPTAWEGVQNIERSMLNEPPPAGHRKNLLSSTFHQVGVGIYIDSKRLIWITEDFVN
jgi:uncharacterized protein YkwD